ncbi:MAG: hypothetical protein AB3X46_09205 [Leptothrix ochracea]|uniref:hypothetical protein n=1 Tax=Leptothrix ochracea TaxID=735331 RepID=UPI0034E20767
MADDKTPPNTKLSRGDLHQLVWGRLAQASGSHGRSVADFSPSGLAEFVAETVQDVVDPQLVRSDLAPLREQVERLTAMVEENGRESARARAQSEHFVSLVLKGERQVNENINALRSDYAMRQSGIEGQLAALTSKLSGVKAVADDTEGRLTRYRNAVGSVVLAALAGLAWVVQHYFDIVIDAILRGIPPKG